MIMADIVPYELMDYGDGQIAVDDAQITYIQKGDCTERDDDVQSITLSARNNGVARFVNIKTENWSIEDGEELLKIVNDFMNRAGIEKEMS